MRGSFVERESGVSTHPLFRALLLSGSSWPHSPPYDNRLNNNDSLAANNHHDNRHLIYTNQAWAGRVFFTICFFVA